MKGVSQEKNLLQRFVNQFRSRSLSYAPFHASMLVILGIAIFTGLFWVFNEYQTFNESITNIRHNYNTLYQNRVREELGKVERFIDDQRTQAALRTENELREKVQSAYTIASHIFQMYKGEKSIPELRSMVAEILRPIRWSDDRGYYFTGRLKDNTIDLFSDDPFLEGHPFSVIKDQTGRSISSDLITILSAQKAGMYRFRLVKNNFPGKSFQTVLFIKYFDQFDWYIAAAVSTDALENILQENILKTLRNMQFGDDGYIHCFRTDGTIISHHKSNLAGRSITDLIDNSQKSYGARMLDIGQNETKGGLVRYNDAHTYPEKTGQRIAFVKSYPDWNWILVANISMDAMEKAIEKESRTYTTISFKNVFIFIALFAAAALSLLGMAYYHSLKIKHGINLFTDFFRKAAGEKMKIQDTEMIFVEFEELAGLANVMVDDLIQKERTLRLDEIRLDTLLQLGMMDEYDSSQKYDFVLLRIVQITGSAGGYIALVNDNQTNITVYSRVDLNADQVGLDPEEAVSPVPLNKSGLLKNCILNKENFISNQCEYDCTPFYPYKKEVQQRLDVPIGYPGKIAMVAGIFNSDHGYDNSDVRQMTMLFEGLWLNILKTEAEKEMARLERLVIVAGEEERSRIGRDLHDDLGAHLSGVELLSKVLQKKLENNAPDEADRMEIIRDLIREAIDKTRRLSRGLYPVHVIEHGLEAAIEELFDEITKLFPLQCTLSFDSGVKSIRNTVIPHVYYVIREAVFNAAKHGKPEVIRVIVTHTDNKLSVTVMDDGCGFSVHEKQEGLGLHTMRYRAKAIGAVLDIQEAENGGTIVSFTGAIFK